MSTKRVVTSSLAAAAIALAATQTAQASLIISYQFDNAGSTFMRLDPGSGGTNVTVQVWATVIGSGTLGIGFANFRAQSQNATTAAFTGGGVTAAAYSPVAGLFDNPPTPGSAADTSSPSDGIRDLGLNPSAFPTSADPKARAYPAPNGAGAGYYVSQGGWTSVSGGAKIQLGTYTVQVGALTSTGGRTAFKASVPQVTGAATWFENASSLNASSGIKVGSGAFSAGTSVTFATAVYKYALTTNNDATLGTANSTSLAVVGSNKKYYDPIDGIPANGTSADFAIANSSLGVGGEVPVLVMVQFDLGTSGTTLGQLAGYLTDVSPDTPGAGNPVIVNGNSPDQRMADLLAAYGNFDPTKTLLFEYNTAPGAVSGGLHFGFDLTDSGISVARVIAVPEPASLGLLGLGAVGMLKRRRK